MYDRLLEARFEEQVEELTDRLNQCLDDPTGPESEIARHILAGLITGYQEQLMALRNQSEGRTAPADFATS